MDHFVGLDVSVKATNVCLSARVTAGTGSNSTQQER
jgi:hypothetical protein